MSPGATPWVESPTTRIDLALPLRQRFEQIPERILQLGRELLEPVTRMIPTRAGRLAPLVHVRTANRFFGETRALARRVNHEIYQTTCTRFDHPSSFFANHQPADDVADEALLYALPMNGSSKPSQPSAS